MAQVTALDASQDVGVAVDFQALLAGVRSLKPKCAECEIPLQESVTGVRTRLTDEGKVEKLCRACAVAEIGESLVATLPR